MLTIFFEAFITVFAGLTEEHGILVLLRQCGLMLDLVGCQQPRLVMVNKIAQDSAIGERCREVLHLIKKKRNKNKKHAMFNANLMQKRE